MLHYDVVPGPDEACKMRDAREDVRDIQICSRCADVKIEEETNQSYKRDTIQQNRIRLLRRHCILDNQCTGD